MGTIKEDMEQARSTAEASQSPAMGMCDCQHALLRHKPPPPGVLSPGTWGACAAIGCACRGAKRNGNPIAWLTTQSREELDAKVVPADQPVVPSLLAAKIEVHIAAITLLILTAYPDGKLSLTADALSGGLSITEKSLRHAVALALKAQHDYPEQTTSLERSELHQRAMGHTRTPGFWERDEARRIESAAAETRKLNSRRKAP